MRRWTFSGGLVCSGDSVHVWACRRSNAEKAISMPVREGGGGGCARCNVHFLEHITIDGGGDDDDETHTVDLDRHRTTVDALDIFARLSRTLFEDWRPDVLSQHLYLCDLRDRGNFSRVLLHHDLSTFFYVSEASR